MDSSSVEACSERSGWPDTLSAALDRAVRRWPEHVALCSTPDGVSLTYRELGDAVGRAAGAFASHGVRYGDRVAVMLTNRSEYPILWLACARVGAVLVPVNSQFQRMDARYVVHHAGVRLVVTDTERRPLIDQIERGDAVAVLNVDDVRVLAGEPAPANPRVCPDSRLNIQYTSGTTGQPKGCVLSHRYWMNYAFKNVFCDPHVDHADVFLTAQPFSYLDPQWKLATTIAAGATFVMLDRFHPATFWESVKTHEATVFYCLGVMPRLMLKVPRSPAERSHKLRTVLCSGIPRNTQRELEQRFGVPWLETYGMTETGRIAVMRAEDHEAYVGSGAVGRVSPNREIRLMNDSGATVEHDIDGEVLVRGIGMMDGYFDDPQATEVAFKDGWFHTGDIGRLDERGFLFLVGRTKDMIRRSGENVAAAEVEEALERHPAVALAACVPVPDELRGEEVKAYVVLTDHVDDVSFKEVGLPAYCAELLAYFKVPRYWEYRSELPVTASAKVAKAALTNESADLRISAWDRVDGTWR